MQAASQPVITMITASEGVHRHPHHNHCNLSALPSPVAPVAIVSRYPSPSSRHITPSHVCEEPQHKDHRENSNSTAPCWALNEPGCTNNLSSGSNAAPVHATVSVSDTLYTPKPHASGDNSRCCAGVRQVGEAATSPLGTAETLQPRVVLTVLLSNSGADTPTWTSRALTPIRSNSVAGQQGHGRQAPTQASTKHVGVDRPAPTSEQAT